MTGNPPEPNAAFRFTGSLSFNPSGFTLTNGQSTTFYRAGGQPGSPAPWDVTEDSVDNYVLDSVQCQAVTVPGGQPGSSTVAVSGRSAVIHPIVGEHVTCVFTNRYVPPPGGLTIRKITEGAVGTFGYTVKPSSGSGQTEHVSATTTDQGTPVDAEPSLVSLAPGSYEIQEHSPNRPDGAWRLTSVRCNNVPRTEPVKVTIHSGAQVTCVFTNAFTPRGVISLAKVTQGGVGRAGFEITPTQGPPATYLQSAITTKPDVAAHATPHTPQDATNHLKLGSYRIIEEPPATGAAGHWTLIGVRCNGQDVPFAEGAIVVTLTRQAPAVHCQFTNLFLTHPPPDPLPGPPDPPPPDPPLPPKPDPDQPSDPYSNLSVLKRPSASSVVTGGVIRYRLTVTNHGPDAADRVILRDQHELGRATVSSIHTTAGHCWHRGDVICVLGTIRSHHSVTVTVDVRAGTTTGTLSDRVVVGSATLDPTLANNIDSARIQIVRRVHTVRAGAPVMSAR